MNHPFRSKLKCRLLVNLFALLFLSVCTLPVLADAEISSIELLPGDITLKPGTALKLKALALKSNPELHIDKVNLLAVEILAKSREGKGKLRLRVGNNLTAWTNVPGVQNGYDSLEPETFSTIKFVSPEKGEKKVWQLLANGYLKIRKITLYMTEPKSTPGGSI